MPLSDYQKPQKVKLFSLKTERETRDLWHPSIYRYRDSNSDRQVSTHKSLSICHIWSRTSIKVMDTVVPALTDQHQRHGESPRHSILVTWGRHWRWSGDWFLWSTTSKRLMSSTWDSQTSQGLELDWQQRPLHIQSHPDGGNVDSASEVQEATIGHTDTVLDLQLLQKLTTLGNQSKITICQSGTSWQWFLLAVADRLTLFLATNWNDVLSALTSPTGSSVKQILSQSPSSQPRKLNCLQTDDSHQLFCCQIQQNSQLLMFSEGAFNLLSVACLSNCQKSDANFNKLINYTCFYVW